ncbi:MAG TPA: PilC/PilY family type IV pilus protein [Steroidobacteraceae bacterium]|nr:PilC/PilY family type IV pilus protein [Steroidobacteraceae bacterium]
MSSKSFVVRMLHVAVTAALAAMTGAASAAPLAITDTPLFLNSVVAPLNMLVVGRDHKLFYEAYADHADLTGDGTLDVGYQGLVVKPDGKFKIDYYGYFDSYKCYTHNGSNFVPASVNTTKKCSAQWSGDWLNWATTSRIDALRKVLYGGKRSTDSPTDTVIERSLIPQDAHSWGKEYTSAAIDLYNISDVTPYSTPTAGTRHFFANTTLMTTTDWTTNTDAPLLRVLLNQPSPRRIWNWVSKESPVAGGSIDIGAGNISVTPTDLPVRVQVCVASMPEINCKQYPNNYWKPTGLLQDFGENDTMLFGLLTGSYQKSKSGGVLRKQIGTITDEIKPADGTLLPLVGIIRTMDLLRPAGYANYTTQAGGFGTVYNGGLVADRPFNEGEHGGNWGNPVAEMMYEALRYFAGKNVPTAAFDYATPGIDGTAPLSLPKASWTNSDPYRTGKPSCAKPFETVMSDVNTSYDSDQLPGSYFNGFTGDLAGMNVATEGDKIWGSEFGAAGNYFIGQSKTDYDGAPTPKSVDSFATIRGLSPEEPTKEGTYYSASVAHYGLTTDLSAATGNQKAQTFAIALASPLPRIEIPAGGRMITLVPYAKSVGGCCGVDGTKGRFQPTNQIVDFYVEFIAADRKSGSFQVNFEDVEAGNDHDMDAIVRYTYLVNADNTVTVTLSSDYAAGGIIQHMGYVISGTTRDGIYLEVRDRDTTADVDYFLDTPDAFVGTPPAPNAGADKWSDGAPLALLHSRTFTAGATPSAAVLKDPLWYAAKWGGFEDSNSNDVPDVQSEWDQNGDGNPDNYFLVTNALKLKDQLSSAFDEIIRRTGSASSASVNTGSISSDTRVYQAKFNSGEWGGQLLSYPVNPADGSLLAPEWDAAIKLNAQTPTSRVIITKNADTSAGVPFRWANIGTIRQGQLQPTADGRGSLRLDYLRGDSAQEQTSGGLFRDRPTKLGDIVSSSPTYVGKPPMGYPDALESQPYSTFAATNANRPKMVYVGANDGMLHGFDAGTGATKGQEKFAFIPGGVFSNLHELTKPNYTHKFFVDGTPTVGDAFYGSAWHTVLLGSLNKGGKSIFALDVTNPSGFSEANASSIYRWEFTDADLGLTYSRPVIAKLHDGKWYAIFGNGYNNTQGATPVSTTGRAALFIVDIETGVLAKKIVTNVAGNPGAPATPNGLATPALVDTDRDLVMDFAYAGDLLGNMWKFDLRGATFASWVVAYGGVPLFVAKDAAGVRQPITSRPEVGRGPKGAGLVVLVGTGKFMEPVDKSPTQTESFYGVYDKNTFVTATDVLPATVRSVLTAQTILAEQTFTFTTPAGTSVTLPLRVTSDNAIGTKRGWYMDFLSPPSATFRGEMQVSNSILRNGRVIFTTLIPDANPCSGGGTSWLMEMDSLTGSRLEESPFDSNEDGIFSEADMVTITLADGTIITAPVSGLQSEVGIAQAPGILFTPGTPAVPGGPGGPGTPPQPPMEFKYLSGSSPNASGSTLHRVRENPGVNSKNRQSWRQVK